MGEQRSIEEDRKNEKERKNSSVLNMRAQTELSNGCSLAIRTTDERQNGPFFSVAVLHDLMDLMQKGNHFFCLSMKGELK